MKKETDNTRIVVIDDERDVVTFLGTVLTDGGFEVHGSNDCRSGLELIRDVNPALICLDVLMPERSGLSLYRELRQDERHSRVPILLISGLGIRAELAQMLDGLPLPDGYLEKPIEVQALLTEVRKLLAAAGC